MTKRVGNLFQRAKIRGCLFRTEMGRPSHTRSSALKMRPNNMEIPVFNNQKGGLSNFKEFFVGSACKRLGTHFTHRNGLSISHTRSSALKMRSNNMEHPMLTTERAKSHKMGLGTCLNKKWWHHAASNGIKSKQ